MGAMTSPTLSAVYVRSDPNHWPESLSSAAPHIPAQLSGKNTVSSSSGDNTSIGSIIGGSSSDSSDSSSSSNGGSSSFD